MSWKYDSVTEECASSKAISPLQRADGSEYSGCTEDSDSAQDSEQFVVVSLENHTAISYKKALEILDSCVNGNIPNDKISLSRPLSPPRGQTFPLGSQNFKNKSYRRCDNYQWKHDGVKEYPNKNDPAIVKTTHKIRVQVNGKYKGFSDFVRLT